MLMPEAAKVSCHTGFLVMLQTLLGTVILRTRSSCLPQLEKSWKNVHGLFQSVRCRCVIVSLCSVLRPRPRPRPRRPPRRPLRLRLRMRGRSPSLTISDILSKMKKASTCHLAAVGKSSPTESDTVTQRYMVGALRNQPHCETYKALWDPLAGEGMLDNTYRVRNKEISSC